MQFGFSCSNWLHLLLPYKNWVYYKCLHVIVSFFYLGVKYPFSVERVSINIAVCTCTDNHHSVLTGNCNKLRIESQSTTVSPISSAVHLGASADCEKQLDKWINWCTIQVSQCCSPLVLQPPHTAEVWNNATKAPKGPMEKKESKPTCHLAPLSTLGAWMLFGLDHFSSHRQNIHAHRLVPHAAVKAELEHNWALFSLPVFACELF